MSGGLLVVIVGWFDWSYRQTRRPGSGGAGHDWAARSASARGGTPTQNDCQPPVMIVIFMMKMMMAMTSIMVAIFFLW